MHLNDKCPDMPWEGIFYARYPSHPDRKALRFTTHPLVCGIYDGPTLRNALSHMPMLHSITLGLEYRTVHGIPWPVLHFILSLPQLREFSLRFHHFAPKTPQEDVNLACPAPLTSFEHTLNDRRPQNTFYDPGDGEEHAISVVLSGVHKTMERLVLTTEIAPLRAICTTLDWPNLRELRLRGGPRTVGDPPLPIIALFAHMSRLRILDLKLTQPAESPPKPIWPLGYKSTFPWPELQELTVSFPVNRDRIYTNLPATLRTLTLQCFPHITSKYRQYGAEGVSGPIQSSGLLRILRRCKLPLLSSLELEYREDDEDDELLHHLGAAFPALRQLKVRRYRRADVRMADVQVVGTPRAPDSGDRSRSDILTVRYRSILRARLGVSRSPCTSPYTWTTSRLRIPGWCGGSTAPARRTWCISSKRRSMGWRTPSRAGSPARRRRWRRLRC